jgi:molybdopterin-guanine dinucleotide biosynthesis protein A
MIEIAGMLMVGALGRNSGKTEFACSLISKFSSKSSIVGIKVTTVADTDGGCPHGAGCGACASLDGYYDITEEKDHQSDKDTCRMLAAGATRVFWLRVIKTHLAEGISALLETIGTDAICVCESNSLRQVAEPGLFLMFAGRQGQESKPSAMEVGPYVDRKVSFDGNKFDIGLDEIGLTDGTWTLRTQATAIIMAGGDSARAGQDKSMLEVAGQPMIKHIYDQLRPHFNQILVSANDAGRYSFLDADVIADRIADQGPLMGIASAVEASANEVNFVTACDIPQVDTFLMRRMLRECKDYDVVVPRWGDCRYEPLFAVYRKSVLETMNKLLASGRRKIDEVYKQCRMHYIDITNSRSLANINTMADYRKFVNEDNDTV